jgi:uncharacterized protein
MARITVRVHPRAKRSAIIGRLGEAYKLGVAAPPEDGKANAECIRFLAELAGVPRASVRIVKGPSSRTKVVEVDGLDDAELERRLVYG